MEAITPHFIFIIPKLCPARSGTYNTIKQDRRWNADKPSAALDPCIPTWSTTSPANYRPANFWKTFFLKHWKEIVKSGAISGWTDEDKFKFEVSLSLSLPLLSLSI